MQGCSYQEAIRPHTHRLSRFTIIPFVSRWTILTLWEQESCFHWIVQVHPPALVYPQIVSQIYCAQKIGIGTGTTWRGAVP